MLNAKQILQKIKVNEEGEADQGDSKPFDVKAAVQSLIDVEFSKSDEEKGKAKELLSGLFFSEDPMAKDVIKKLDDWFGELKV